MTVQLKILTVNSDVRLLTIDFWLMSNISCSSLLYNLSTDCIEDIASNSSSVVACVSIAWKHIYWAIA
jgi:hypothetical protein